MTLCSINFLRVQWYSKDRLVASFIIFRLLIIKFTFRKRNSHEPNWKSNTSFSKFVFGKLASSRTSSSTSNQSLMLFVAGRILMWYGCQRLLRPAKGSSKGKGLCLKLRQGRTAQQFIILSWIKNNNRMQLLP